MIPLYHTKPFAHEISKRHSVADAEKLSEEELFTITFCVQ